VVWWRALLDFEETQKTKVHGRPVSSLRAHRTRELATGPPASTD